MHRAHRAVNCLGKSASLQMFFFFFFFSPLLSRLFDRTSVRSRYTGWSGLYFRRSYSFIAKRGSEIKKIIEKDSEIIEGRENAKGNCIYGKFNTIAIVTGKHASDKRYR